MTKNLGFYIFLSNEYSSSAALCHPYNHRAFIFLFKEWVSVSCAHKNNSYDVIRTNALDW